jgi:hypothetical protein
MLTHKQICAKGGMAKSEAKTLSGRLNLEKARLALQKKRQTGLRKKSTKMDQLYAPNSAPAGLGADQGAIRDTGK